MTLPDKHEPDANDEKRRKGDYVVGKCRPPIHTRWRPGQSGNPSGRRKGRRNVKTELMEVMSKQFTFRDGETERKLSLHAANVFAHAIKGAKGDVRSAGLFLKYAHQMGLLEEGDAAEIETADRGDQGMTGAPVSKSRPNDGLFEHLDPDLLSHNEQIELSRFAEVVDGDITALSTADFERVKHIVNKGRGKGITAH
jgi:hypothetical protein